MLSTVKELFSAFLEGGLDSDDSEAEGAQPPPPPATAPARAERAPSTASARSSLVRPSHPGRILKVVKGGASVMPASLRYNTGAKDLPQPGTRVVPGGSGAWVPPGCGCWLDKARILKQIKRGRRERPGLPRTVLRPCEMHVLIDQLPGHLRWTQWELAFSTDEHGFSPETMREQLQRKKDVLAVVHTTDGRVCGAYLPAMPDWGHPGRFAGSGETFVYSFKLNGELEAYHWRPADEAGEGCDVPIPFVQTPTDLELTLRGGEGGGDARRRSSLSLSRGSGSQQVSFSEPLYNHCFTTTMQDHALAIGGGASGAALLIDSDLRGGRTSKCATFASPPLVSSTPSVERPETADGGTRGRVLAWVEDPASEERPMTSWGARRGRGQPGPRRGEGELFVRDAERFEPVAFTASGCGHNGMESCPDALGVALFGSSSDDSSEAGAAPPAPPPPPNTHREQKAVQEVNKAANPTDRDAKFTIAHLEFWTFDDMRMAQSPVSAASDPWGGGDDSPAHLLISPSRNVHIDVGPDVAGAVAGNTLLHRGDTPCTAYAHDARHHVCLV